MKILLSFSLLLMGMMTASSLSSGVSLSSQPPARCQAMDICPPSNNSGAIRRRPVYCQSVDVCPPRLGTAIRYQ